MKITKTFTWDMAHRLTNHKGKCYNLHGHTYKAEITIAGDIDKNGFVMDFGDLKEIVKNSLLDEFDHSFLCYVNDDIGRQIKQHNNTLKRPMKIIDFPEETTAEHISNYIFNILKDRGVNVCKVMVWETPTSQACYESI